MEQRRTHKRARLQEGDHIHSQGTSHGHRREEALQQIKKGFFKYLPKEIRDDEEIALAAIHRNPCDFAYVSDRLKNHKALVLVAVKMKGTVLEYASKALRADREVVLAAIRKSGFSLVFASLELRSDREIVIEAVGNSCRALYFAEGGLRADREVVFAAVRYYGWALRNAAEELRADRDIVFAAVRQYGRALLFASAELRADREVVMEAVQQTGEAFKFASEELRGVREIVLVAVRQHGRFLEHASEELRGDQEIILVAIENTEKLSEVEEFIVRHMSEDLKNDPRVAGALLRKGLPLARGSEIMGRLEKVLLAVRALPEFFAENVVDEESVVELSRRWESLVWHKIWMVLQLEPPGMEGTGRLFVELSGVPLELRQAKELRDFAPLVGAVFLFQTVTGEISIVTQFRGSSKVMRTSEPRRDETEQRHHSNKTTECRQGG